MKRFQLSNEEDLCLHFSILLPSGRSLYEYFCELPLDKLEVYPKKGYHWWMGKATRTPQALALRDYIFYWRVEQLHFRQTYPREYLEALSPDILRLFLSKYLKKTPLWAYEGPIRDTINILFHRAESDPDLSPVDSV